MTNENVFALRVYWLSRVLSMIAIFVLSTGKVMAVGAGFFANGLDLYNANCTTGCHTPNDPNSTSTNGFAPANGDDLTPSGIKAFVASGIMGTVINLSDSEAAHIACLLQSNKLQPGTGSGIGFDCVKTVTALSVDDVADGGVTTDNSPTLRGVLSVPLTTGESVHILRGAVNIEVPPGNVAGVDWVFTDTLTDDGTYQYTARIEGGAVGASSAPYRITLDRQPPAGAGMIDKVEDDVLPVTGTVSNGGFTNDTSPRLTGNAPAGDESIRVYANGVRLPGTAVRSGTAWSYSASGLTDATTYAFTIRLFKESNQIEGVDSNPYGITVDTTAPAQTTTLAATDEVAGVKLVNGDSSIDSTPLLSGSLSADLAEGEVLHVFRGGVEVGVFAGPGRDWKITDPGGLVVGTGYAYTARVVDAAGNQGPDSGPFGLTLIAPVPVNLTGRVTLADGTPCGESDPFFDTDVRTTGVVAVDAGGRELDNIRTSVFGPGGEYQLFAPQGVTPAKLRAVCEGTVNGVAVKGVAEATVSGSGPVLIAFGNSRPVIEQTTVFFPVNSGFKVNGVPLGSTVRGEVTATDPEGDGLRYQWKSNVTFGNVEFDGATPSVRWTVPAGKGLQTLYYQVFDGQVGGVATVPLGADKLRVFPVSVSTDRGVQPDRGRRAPVIGTAELIFGSDQFLAFAIRSGHKVLDTRQGACQYYKKIGMVADCQVDGTPISPMSFRDWKDFSGFGQGKPAKGEVVAAYRNRVDLNIARDMHAISIPSAQGEEGAFYVCNHLGGPDLVRRGLNEANCVAMDYRRIEGINGGAPFLRALVFGPGGDLRLSVDLDGRGEKFVPGSCIACHGGEQYFAPTWDTVRFPAYPDDGSGPADLGIRFIPFDLDNFQYSTTANLSRSAQKGRFRKFNAIVAKTAFTPASKELIDGWHPKAKSRRFVGRFIPEGWKASTEDKARTEDQNFYRAVVKPYCRSCHVNLARSGRDDLDFDRASDVAGNTNFFTVLCGTKSEDGKLDDISQFARMPNAANIFTLLQSPIDPDNFFARENRGKRAVADYFRVLKARGAPAAADKLLLNEDCDLPWRDEALWGPLPQWLRELDDSIPRRNARSR